VSGETADWHQLAHRTLDELEHTGMRLLLRHTATSVDPSRHEVCVENSGGQAVTLGYDQLVVATGAGPIRPAMPGLDLPSVHVLHTMDHSFAVHDVVAPGRVHEAAIVGSGYIGLEMADALTQRGVHVKLFGRAETVLRTVDQSLGNCVAAELQRHGVTVHAGVPVEGIERARGDRLLVRGRRRHPV
jgi:NADPH-dependent 2,4-dienoyl-CoA reductase/sulfur reductase-like enzyme